MRPNAALASLRCTATVWAASTSVASLACSSCSSADKSQRIDGSGLGLQLRQAQAVTTVAQQRFGLRLLLQQAALAVGLRNSLGQLGRCGDAGARQQRLQRGLCVALAHLGLGGSGLGLLLLSVQA